MLLLYAAIAALVLLPVFRAVTSPLRAIPGPFIARFTRLWYLVRVARGDFESTNCALHRRYGPFVRLAPKLYSIDMPGEAITTVYGTASRMPKSAWYDTWDRPNPLRRSIFSERSLQRHAETRRCFKSLYSMTSLLSYEEYVERCTDLLMQRLDEIADRGGHQAAKGDDGGENDGSIDVLYWFQCFAFDVIGDMTYSSRFGFLDRGEDAAGLLPALQLKFVYSTLMGIFSELHAVAYPVLDWLGIGGAAGIGHLTKIVRRFMSERRQQREAVGSAQEKKQAPQSPNETGQDSASPPPQDFLDKLFDQQERNPETTTDDHIFLVGMSNIAAGADSTAITLAAILYYLLRNPGALAKLQAETDETVGKRVDADDVDEGDEEATGPEAERRRGRRLRLRFRDTLNMPYLQAVIKEAMRLHPATGLPLWRDVVADEGVVLGGQRFPRGSTLGLNAWCAHHNESVFGEDAGEFRPERWLEGNEEKTKQMNAYFLPFGMGARSCVGQHISMMEMSKLIPLLIKRYNFEPVDGNKRWKTKNVWFVKPVDYRVRVGRRA